MRRAATGAVLALAVDRLLQAAPPGGAARWQRTNHRGRSVTLLAGPALVVAATASSGLPVLAAAAAGLGAGAVGAYDDAAGSADRAKGLRGHAAALREGRLTAGAVKVGGIGLAGLAAAVALPGRRRPFDVAVDAALVAGSANLLNLLDLRPGRALKTGGAAAAALGLGGPAGAAAALLPADLREKAMIGDAGANGLGALLGLALAYRTSSRGRRTAALAVVTGLTVASEKVSFTQVIERTRPLRVLDRLGRLP